MEVQLLLFFTGRMREKNLKNLKTMMEAGSNEFAAFTWSKLNKGNERLA